MPWRRLASTTFVLVMLSLLAGCQTATPTPAPSPKPSPTLTPTATPTSSVTYSQWELEYLVLANFPDVFYCDPDYYPIGRPGQEQQNAIDQFPAIRAYQAEFAAILQHLGLPDKPDYTDAEKLAIYREHKKLTLGVQMTPVENGYRFTLREGQGQGQLITGTVTPSGAVTVTQRQPSFNTCPICLSRGTLIDTPNGPVAVELLKDGMPVWTRDAAGNRVAGTVLETGSTPVPAGFSLVKIILDDGRSVTAAPGHSLADGRSLSQLSVGDAVDGAKVTFVGEVSYHGDDTYDLLPSGSTQVYWADGIPMKTTMPALQVSKGSWKPGTPVEIEPKGS